MSLLGLALGAVSLTLTGFGPNDGTRLFPQPELPKNALGLPAHDPNVVLVAFQPNSSLKDRHALIRSLGLEMDTRVVNPYFYRLIITDEAKQKGANVESMLKALIPNKMVRVAERDWIVTIQQTFPNDPMFSQLYGMHNTGQTGGTADADIDAPTAWAIQTGSSNVKVAVIDTGVDYTHPDLAANAWTNPGEVAGNNVDDDGNGYVDDIHGYDFLNNDGNPMDDNSHGTHCSGTIGGVGNNGVGVVGVSWNVRIIGVKFLSAGGSGSISNAILCTDYARIVGSHVMSNSWGGGGFSQLMLDAITRADQAGILFVAAAGNNGSNNDSTTFYPASYNSSVGNMLAVGASTHNDTRASFSNYGANTVDIFAPGENIVSSVPIALTPAGYDTYSGTSMACPHVSGAAALLKAQFPGDNATQLRARLRNSADPVAALSGLTATGRLNAYNSMDNDTVAPGTPSGLVGIKRSSGTIRLRFTASGDDGAVGTANSYDMRVSSSPINAGNFTAARRVSTPPPTASGTQQEVAASGLNAGAPYYFALKALDNVGNASGIVTAGPYTTLPGLFVDNMEGAATFTPQGGSPWALTNSVSFSPTQSWTDSPGGNYANSIDISLTKTTPIAITAPTLMRVMVKSSLERNYDYLYIEASTNGVNWTSLYRTDASFDWSPVSVNLSGYVGQNVQIRFRLTTDSSVVYDGVYIDDLTLVAMTTVWNDGVEGAANFSGQAPWAIVTENASSPTHSWHDSPGGNYVDNLDIALTQNAAVNLPTVESPQVFFKMSYDLESGYDYLTVYSSTDNGASWAAGAAFTGTNTAWSTYQAPLSSGSSVMMRFRLTTDYSVVRNGVYIDDISVAGEPCEPISSTLPISGTITLEDFVGTVSGTPIVVEIRPVGSSTVLETINGTLGSGGTFTVQTTQPAGNYDVAIKAPTWLRKIAANRTLSGAGMTGVNLTVKNGDLDNDNEVGISDYAILSSNYGGSGPVGDINGDGDVDIADYAILSANYGQLGDD
ncbi:MAG: S8 family serine peptidase [Fimbriimonadaceae bacterium]|nr:S8 family serine peptidase [Fimbriimonadaceae bacterium]